jgi:hypothetical protein
VGLANCPIPPPGFGISKLRLLTFVRDKTRLFGSGCATIVQFPGMQLHYTLPRIVLANVVLDPKDALLNSPNETYVTRTF